MNQQEKNEYIQRERNKQLLIQLAVATRHLIQAVEEYVERDLVQVELEICESLLSQIPNGMVSAQIVDSDLDISFYKTNNQELNEPARGVKIKHLPTGIAGQSESKPTQEENKAVVMRYLQRRVAQEYERQQAISS
jgi:hypothetical protein